MNIKIIGVVGALGIVLAGSMALAQAAPAQRPDGVPPAEQPPLITPPVETPVGGKDKPGQVNRPERPEHPDKPGRDTDAVKAMLEEIKASRSKFLQEQNELQEKIKDATRDQREQLRAEIKEKREKFLEQQKDMREEYRKRVIELKEQLKDHGDVIDQAKEQAKNKVNRRKGGDD